MMVFVSTLALDGNTRPHDMFTDPQHSDNNYIYIYIYICECTKRVLL